MKIVLINGKKRSGKDHLAHVIKTQLESRGIETEITSFADPLKDILCCTFNISRDSLDEFKNNEYDVLLRSHHTSKLSDFRTILQRFGTEAMKRQFGDDVWVNLLLKRAKQSTADVLVVPDFRFTCEAISECTINVFDETLRSEDRHSSENGLEDFQFKYKVNNTGRPDLTNVVSDIINAEF